MTDRFDLEQQILDCWKVVDDVSIVYENIMDNNHGDLSTDDIANLLLGIKTLYNLKFNKCWDTFEHVMHDMLKEKRELRMKAYDENSSSL